MAAADAKEKKSKPKSNPDPNAKPKKIKPAKVVPAEAAAPAPVVPAAPAAPRPPADPRLKVWKRFTGRYLPKGPLRVRLSEITVRWNSDETHGDVSVEELRALLADWKASRETGPRAAKRAKALTA